MFLMQRNCLKLYLPLILFAEVSEYSWGYLLVSAALYIINAV